MRPHSFLIVLLTLCFGFIPSTFAQSGPSITGVSPTAAPYGTSVTITGTNFGATQGTSRLTFNGTAGTPTSWSATTIVVPVPWAASTGNVVVTVGGVNSNGVSFTVVPHIDAVNPLFGSVGTSVEVYGEGFGATQGTSTVTFNGTIGTPTYWDKYSITVPVPSGATNGNVVVTVGGLASNGVGFAVTSLAIVQSNSRVYTLGPVSVPFLSNNTAGNLLWVGVGSDGPITAPTDTLGNSYVLAVSVNGTNGSGNAAIYYVASAKAGSNTVSCNHSGTWLTMCHIAEVAGLASNSPLDQIGSVASSSTCSVSTSGATTQADEWVAAFFYDTAISQRLTPLGGYLTMQMSYDTPAYSHGALSASGVPAWTGVQTVTCSGNGPSEPLTQLITTFKPQSGGSGPSITGLSPTFGAVGAPVTISGTSFGATQGASTVKFNGTTATPTSWSNTSIVVPVPSGATTGNVVATVGGGASNGVSFTVLPTPSISILSPTSGTVGTSVTITGTNFGSTQGSSTVMFGDMSAPVTAWSNTQIMVTVPGSLATGSYSVYVDVPPLSSGTYGFQVIAPVSGFVTTSGQMGSSRYGQTATQLTTGQVLIAGGMSTSGVVNGAELYTPSSQTFAPASSMNVARWLHTATLLNDGTVLIAGGSDLVNQETLDTAEIYDPVAGTFALLSATLNTARVGHSATLLSDGQVLIVGGYDPATGIIADAELYDPTAQVFIDLGNTNAPRFRHTTTLLQNGQVLIAGGEKDPTPTGAYNTAEIFNPATWAFTTLSANLTTAREGHAATLLNNGEVLITGGNLPGTGSLNTAEIYDPTANTFTAVSSTMTTPRIYHNSVLLNGGQVLLSGGEDDTGGNSTTLNTAEVYDPIALAFTAVPGSMTTTRLHQTVTLLNDGTVLEDGGTDGTNIFKTAEIYTSSRLAGLMSIAVSPVSPSIPIGTQQLLVATGTFSDGSTQVLSSALWSSSSPGVSAMSNDASDAGFASSATQGTATISATAAGISGTAIVTVSAPSLVSIILNPQTPTMPLGTTQQFTAVGTYSDGSVQDLTAAATWTSSSPSATVTSSGLVVGVSLGISVIQVSSGSISSSTNVTVGAPILVSLALTPTTATIAFGATQQYQVIGIYTDGSTSNLTNSASWFVVPSETASVNGAGLATGLGQGTVTITVVDGAFLAVGSLTVQAPVAPSLVAVVLTPNQASIPIGGSQQFVATGNYSDGSTQDLTSTVSWTSSNAAAVSVSSSGLATAASQGSSTLTASSGSVSGTTTISVTASTSGLNTSRYQHSATLLNNGSVLIAGGVNCPSSSSCTYLNSAELYNPASGTFVSTGSLAAARSAPAVLLGSAKVLIAGGYSCEANGNCASLSGAEVYDPNAGAFSSAGNMTIDRYGHTMTLLANGKVLIAGGETCSSSTSCNALKTAELYDPVAGTFTATGSLNAARSSASASILSSGQVLIAGGFDGSTYPAAAELYDPATGTFNAAGSLNIPRANATATWLENSGDMVLIAGGSACGSPGCPTASTEYYQHGIFVPANSMTTSRLDQTATLLTNGQVFFAGGFDSCASPCISDATSELYNPQTSGFISGPPLSTGRSGHTATLLTDGSVFLIGGMNNGVTLNSTESYQPSTLAPPQLTSITITPSTSSLAIGSTLRLIATGYSNGSPIGVLQSVMWNSSAPSVASVSNASGSSGILTSLTAGTTTITASVGTISATAQITVTVPLVSIVVSPSNPSVILNSTQPLLLTATGAYSDGSTSNLTPYVTWSSSNSSIAIFLPDIASPQRTVVMPVAVGTATLTASFGGMNNATTLTVVAPPSPVVPNIADVSPTSGPAGTQVTITGSGFGASQGNGTVFLGTTLGAVVSWSDSQVVANVATGSTSGVAQIRQSEVSSNAVTFTVNTATISSITPTSGSAGTQVSITGSGFGNAQGAGQVWLGTAAGQVSSWSDGQVVATVAAGSNSANVQLLQNGVWSNSVPFTVSGAPHISSMSPNAGAPATPVTIQGSGFGSSQGNGTLSIGGVSASVNSWSDTQLSATVGTGAATGVAKVEQNGVWSNAVSFAVPSSGSLTLIPSVISMIVGETRPMQSVNAQSQSVTGLTWTSSDTTIATLSTDDPPYITAVAPGNVTISAGGATADVTVYAGASLPLGSVIWSNPGNGSGPVSGIYPAVPSATGVADVFAEQNDGSIQALTSDGIVAWSYNQQGEFWNSYLPDFQGGLVVLGRDALGNNDASIYKLDGISGQPYPAYTTTTNEGRFSGLEYPVIHTDGTIFTVDYACDTDCPWNADSTDGAWVVGIDPSTGTTKFKVELSNSVERDYAADSWCPGSPGTTTIYSHSWPSYLMIAGDGYLYTAYRTQDFASTERQSVAQHFPVWAYPIWNQLLQDTSASNFNAALQDVGRLAYLIDTSGIMFALERGDRTGAILAENYFAGQFVPLCDDTQTITTKLHILRVGTDGSSFDMVAGQWSYSQSTVNTASYTDPSTGVSSMTQTQTQSGPAVRFNGPSMITNADTGALFSWQEVQEAYCTVQTGNPLLQQNPSCTGQVNQLTKNHLTTTAGTAIAADVTWNPPMSPLNSAVSPILQRSDGTYVGTAGNQMIAFDQSGNLKWSVPNDAPQIATADGGVIGSSGTTYDQNGNATGQSPSGNTIQSWTGESFAQSTGDVQKKSVSAPDYAETNAATSGGNPATPFNYWKHVGKSYRSLVAALALTQVGFVELPSLDYPTITLCNKFVGEMLDRVRDDFTVEIPSLSTSPDFYSLQKYVHGRILGDRWVYINASDWYNPNFASTASFWKGGQPLVNQVRGGVVCWTPVSGGPDAAGSGDILASATHVGFVVGRASVVSAATWPAVEVPGTIVNNDYGYRVPPATYGLKTASRVKRFTCY